MLLHYRGYYAITQRRPRYMDTNHSRYKMQIPILLALRLEMERRTHVPCFTCSDLN